MQVDHGLRNLNEGIARAGSSLPARSKFVFGKNLPDYIPSMWRGVEVYQVASFGWDEHIAAITHDVHCVALIPGFSQSES